MEKEYYTIKPSLKQYYGRKVTKDTEFEEYTDDKSVHQTFKDLTLTTEINKSIDIGEIKTSESSKIVTSVPEGTILIWKEEDGFIVPNVQFYTLEELEEEVTQIKDIYKEV